MLRYLMFYEDRGLEISYAEGQYVWDPSGRKYLDMHTGHGVAFLGHRHPHIVRSLMEQLNSVMTASTSFRVRVREEMLDALSRIVPKKFEYVYLLNSGSEIVDFALKAARKYTGRRRIVYFTGSFHGRTYGALSVTSNPRYKEGVGPLLADVQRMRFNDVEAVEDGVGEDVAAVIVELIQGEGGVNIASKEFVKVLRRRTEEVGALLIVDEIQTGFGRTGSVWLFEQYGIVPDILLAGKAIGGGYPVSAAFIPGEMAEKLGRGFHGSTYGGNPLACAAVKASVEVLIDENVPVQAKSKGEAILAKLRDRLRGLRIVREVRGAGLMIGIDMRFEPTKVIRCLQENGVLALKAGATVLRLLPPYKITNEDVEYAVSAIERCVRGFSQANAVGSA